MTPVLPVIYTTAIKPEWLDYNQHMNVAYYVLIFDLAGEALASAIGLGEEITRQTGISWMALENHTTYDNEVTLRQEVEVRWWLVDHDHKRLHLYFEMHTIGPESYLAATEEQMILCVDLNDRRSAAFPAAVQAKIQSLADAQTRLQRSPPTNIGRTIGIRRATRPVA
ncbi:MAG: thioesterase family protein [Porticoccaceae bacterium]